MQLEHYVVHAVCFIRAAVKSFSSLFPKIFLRKKRLILARFFLRSLHWLIANYNQSYNRNHTTAVLVSFDHNSQGTNCLWQDMSDFGLRLMTLMGPQNQNLSQKEIILKSSPYQEARRRPLKTRLGVWLTPIKYRVAQHLMDPTPACWFGVSPGILAKHS